MIPMDGVKKKKILQRSYRDKFKPTYSNRDKHQRLTNWNVS